MAAPPDSVLVAAACAGDRRAFAALVGRYHALVMSVVFASTGNLAQSEELAQDVFLSAWTKLVHLKQPDRFRSWLYGIARNAGHNWRRQQRPTTSLETDRSMSAPPSLLFEISPLDQMLKNEEEMLLWRALNTVPEAYRIPLVLFYREGQSVMKVAEAMSISESNVLQRLWRGRRLLRNNVLPLLELVSTRMRPRKEFVAAVLLKLSSTVRPGDAASSPSPAATTPRRASLSAVGFGLIALLAAVALKSARSAPLGPAGRRDNFRPVSDVTRREALPRWVESTRAVVSSSPPSAPVTLLSFDFEDGALPGVFTQGHVDAGPPRSGNRYCLIGTMRPWWFTYSTVTIGDPLLRSVVLFRYSATTTLSFDYWSGEDSSRLGDVPSLAVEVVNRDTNKKFRFEARVWQEMWGHAELRLADFVPTVKDAPMLKDGDPLGALVITSGGRAGTTPLYVDNIDILGYGSFSAPGASVYSGPGPGQHVGGPE